jgi:hypothetical protein
VQFSLYALDELKDVTNAALEDLTGIPGEAGQRAISAISHITGTRLEAESSLVPAG